MAMGSGVSATVSAKSAEPLTVVLAVAELFAVLKSAVGPPKLPVRVCVPVPCALAMMDRMALPPEPR